MFLGYQGDLIAHVAETREELDGMPCVMFDRIDETSQPVVFDERTGTYYIGELPAPTREEIRAQRESRYIAEADPIKHDFDEALARGTDEAEALKTAWLAKKDEIRAELPYPEETDTQDVE